MSTKNEVHRFLGEPLSNAPSNIDLFPEIRIDPVPEKSKRMARSRTAIQSARNKQLAPVLASELIVPDEIESIACKLQAHPDYRVLRRLRPRLHWPAAANGDRVFRVVLLDTETTGLDAGKDKIIELALLRVNVDSGSGQPVGEIQVYDGLEDPGRPIPKEVAALTGIADADVQGQRLDEARIAELLQDIDLVIAHNAGFDRPFCEARLPQFAQVAWACSFADIDWKAQGRDSSKLESLAQQLGLFYDAHRAEMDCHALLAVLTAPLPVGTGERLHNGLTHLVAASVQPSYRLHATNAPFEAKDLLKLRGYRWNAEQKVWHTRLDSEAALQSEREWLREQVYQARAAVVQVEKMLPTVKYSNRSGTVFQLTL